MGAVILLCSLVLIYAASRISSSDVTVKTNVGYLVGFRQDVELFDTVIVKFLGIPYAEPPVGLWRFRNSRPKAPLVKPLRVQQFGNRCLEALVPETVVGSEDCLYLNIYAPDRMSMESLAVMVFIHGGGFYQGSANDYDSDFLAAVGHTIIVTVNYRLHVWGFLSTDDHNSHGNYGLRDQQLAIKWVHDNIEAFGGDNSRITIFGESAGAASVIHQGLYPGNTGMFQRIIAQSGSAAATWATSPNPKENTEWLAQETGCYNESVEAMIECLRYLPASTIHAAADKLASDGLVYFSPTIDNMFVTCKPEDILNLKLDSDVFMKARNMLASVDLMMGINSREGAMAMIPSNGYGDPDTFLPNKTYFDDVMAPALVNAVYGDSLDSFTVKALSDAIARKYTDAEDPQNPYRIREQFMAMHGDFYFLSSTQATIDIHVALSNSMTYLYYLSVTPSFHALPTLYTPPWVKGASHADDLPFLFPFTELPLNEQEEELAIQMINMWTNFAKTGNPNHPVDVGVIWEQYTEAKHNYLDLTTNMTSLNLKQGLHEDMSEFWNTDVPAIIGAKIEGCDYYFSTSKAPDMFKGLISVVSVLLATFCAH